MSTTELHPQIDAQAVPLATTEACSTEGPWVKQSCAQGEQCGFLERAAEDFAQVRINCEMSDLAQKIEVVCGGR